MYQSIDQGQHPFGCTTPITLVYLDKRKLKDTQS